MNACFILFSIFFSSFVVFVFQLLSKRFEFLFLFPNFFSICASSAPASLTAEIERRASKKRKLDSAKGKLDPEEKDAIYELGLTPFVCLSLFDNFSSQTLSASSILAHVHNWLNPLDNWRSSWRKFEASEQDLFPSYLQYNSRCS